MAFIVDLLFTIDKNEYIYYAIPENGGKVFVVLHKNDKLKNK